MKKHLITEVNPDRQNWSEMHRDTEQGRVREDETRGGGQGR